MYSLVMNTHMLEISTVRNGYSEKEVGPWLPFLSHYYYFFSSFQTYFAIITLNPQPNAMRSKLLLLPPFHSRGAGIHEN